MRDISRAAAAMLLFETCKDAASWHASMIMMMITNDFPRLSGFVSMGSVGSWEPINFLAVGSRTYQFVKEGIKF